MDGTSKKRNADGGCDKKYLIGVRGYITEHWKYADDGVVEGVELLYSNGTSTKCGSCSSKNVTDTMQFEKGEHIIGIDFEQDSEDGIDRLTLYTSRPEGRCVCIWTNCMGDWGSDEYGAPFIGVYDSKLTEAGRKFTCRRGRRVVDIKFEGNIISKMITEKIPEGENEKWWEKSLGFKPRVKNTSKSLAQSKEVRVPSSLSVEEVNESSHLVGVKASYKKKDGRDYIVGLELRYSNGQIDKWGKVLKTKMSAELPFGKDGKDEHIVGINFDSGYHEDGITSLELYTSNYGGRAACFSTDYGGGVSAGEDGGCYVGVYGHSKGSLSPKGKKFTCQQGKRVTGITFKNNTITSMTQEAIPEGCNEKWYERSMDYSPDRDPNKPKKRKSKAKSNKAKKAKRSGSITASSNPPAFDEARHRRIMAQVERQSYLVMNDPDYEPEYDSDGNYHPYEGGMSPRRSFFSNRPRSRYGYDGGCYGFNSRDCDDLLDQGIKPWEDDAYGALGAMRGW